MTTPTPTPVLPRDPIWPLLCALRTCTSNQLGFVRRPVTTFPIVAGDRPPPADSCTCTTPTGEHGSGWVRTIGHRLDDSDGRMNTAQMVGTPCTGHRWSHDIEVGVYRCWPAPNSKGRPPSEQALDTAARGLTDDAAALRRVLRCCTWITEKEIPWTNAQVSALGPLGGCIGLALTATVLLEECDCPTVAAPVLIGGGSR